MQLEPIPRRILGNDAIDPWRDEMLRSLFDGAAIPGRRQRLAALQRKEQENDKPKITLPSGYEPAYLR